MGSMWDAAVKGYGSDPWEDSAKRRKGLATPTESTKSSWESLIDSYTSPVPSPDDEEESGSGNMWDAAVRGYGSDPWEDAAKRREGADPAAAPTKSPWESLIDSYTSPGPMTQEKRTTGQSTGKVDEQYVIDGLVKRGLPKHVAEGFAMNIGDESGFDPGINEKNPTVKGSRGGFGLYQLTGPRRNEYEAMARAKGADLSDPDLQLDFLVEELKTTEKNAAKSIFSTRTAGEAGAAIVEDFLRPAEEHRVSRSRKYLTGGQSYASDAPPKPNKLWLDF